MGATTYVEALRLEREGCKVLGKTDRVKAIDAELKSLGVDEPVEAPAVEAAVADAPETPEKPARRARK